jgi:hypothetical protein
MNAPLFRFGRRAQASKKCAHSHAGINPLQRNMPDEGNARSGVLALIKIKVNRQADARQSTSRRASYA